MAILEWKCGRVTDTVWMLVYAWNVGISVYAFAERMIKQRERNGMESKQYRNINIGNQQPAAAEPVLDQHQRISQISGKSRPQSTIIQLPPFIVI